MRNETYEITGELEVTVEPSKGFLVDDIPAVVQITIGETARLRFVVRGVQDSDEIARAFAKASEILEVAELLA